MEKKVWIALGGGAARAFVGIGVLRFLEENHIRVTEIAGTSMGAILWAFFAMGKNSHEIEEICKNEKDYLKIADWHFGAGILKWEKLKKRLEFYFWNQKIENLSIPLKITATSLEAGELRVFESGKIVDALRASTSIPWIFRPYRLGNEHLMDGGIVKNLPVDLLSTNNKIAVSALKRAEWPIDWNRQIFSFKMKRGFLGIWPQIFGRSIVIMMEQNEISSIKLAEGNVLPLHFQFGELHGGSFSEVEKLVKMGYEGAKEHCDFSIFS